MSPANTYVGLTLNVPPASLPGEPQKYYPTGTRTYLRIVPTDSIQAASDLTAMKEAGCTKVAVANDKEAYGDGLAKLLELEKGFYGVTIVSNTGVDPTAPNFRSYASTIQGQEPIASSPASSPMAPSRSPRTSTRRSPRPRSSAVTAFARIPTRARRRAASQRRFTR